MKKRKLKKIIVAIIIASVLLIGSFATYLVITDLKQEEILRKEIEKLSEKDLTKGNYNIIIKTKGDYAIVEKAIKVYYKDCKNALQNSIKMLEELKISTILTAENYQEDGPEFIKTKEYLEKTKNEFNEKMKELEYLSSDEAILDSFKNKDLDKYYVNLYEELMVKALTTKDIEVIKKELKIKTDKTNKIIDVQIKVIDFLIKEKENWSIQDNKIFFKTAESLNKYSELTKEYKKENSD